MSTTFGKTLLLALSALAVSNPATAQEPTQILVRVIIVIDPDIMCSDTGSDF